MSKTKVWCGVTIVCAAICAAVLVIPSCISFPPWGGCTNANTCARIGVEEQQYAKQVLRTLLNSAQNTYIHRNQTKMAGSIEELGDGFTMGKYGALIYEEIWVARIGCPESEKQKRTSDNPKLQNALMHPYRYAVLPVKDARTEILDNRTTCLIALPQDMAQVPGMVMVAGPIEKDPQDFSRDWNVVALEDTNSISTVRAWVRKKDFINKEKLDWLDHIAKEKK